MLQVGIDRPLISRFFAIGSGSGPLSEIIEPPGPDEVGIGFFWVARCLRLYHIAVGDGAPCCRPLVGIAALDALQRSTGVDGLDAERRVGAGLCPRQRLALDFLDGAIGGLGRSGVAEKACQPSAQDKEECTHDCSNVPFLKPLIMVWPGKGHKGTSAART